MADGDIETDIETASQSPDSPLLTTYDFRRLERVSKDQLKGLQSLFEAFSREIEILLPPFLRTVVRLDLVSIDQLTYDEFILSVARPTSLSIIEMSPLEGRAVLEMSPAVVFPIVDRVLGGKGAALARKVGSAREKLRHTMESDPSYAEIGDEIDVTAEQVEDCLLQVQTAHVLSLDDYLSGQDGDDSRKLDITSDPDAMTPESSVELIERQDFLVRAILGLPDQQQKVLNLYYYEELTLKEIGAVLEVSESRISQIHSAAIKKLRKVVRKQEDA